MDIDSVTDTTQQAAMKTMVKTYGQMPAQLLKEPHPQRAKTAPVLTSFRMRIGNVLKRLTSISPISKIGHGLFWKHVSMFKAKVQMPSRDCDFIGAVGAPDLINAHNCRQDRLPDTIVCVGNREMLVMGKAANFVRNTSASYSSILMVWGNWDNSLIVLATGYEMALKLHAQPFNEVGHHNCILGEGSEKRWKTIPSVFS